MRIERCNISCGSQIMYGLGDWKTELEKHLFPQYRLWRERRNANAIHSGETIIFSDSDVRGNGKAIVAWIKEHGLGDVVSISTRNPNTHNPITTWLWVYNGNVPKPKEVTKKPRAPRKKAAAKKKAPAKKKSTAKKKTTQGGPRLWPVAAEW